MQSSLRILVGLSGASGIIYGMRLVEYLSERQLIEAVIYTKPAEVVAYYEEGINLRDWLNRMAINSFREDEIAAPYASSSNAADAMVIIPCSMNTLASIANGLSNNLLTRAALTMLRLKRPLILVIRETPLGLAELRNMLKAALNGATILPASPAFYHKPRTIDDMVNFVVGKVLDVLGIKHDLYKPWSDIRVSEYRKVRPESL
jgi:4-hydroxy-3-polyprenylbenzoate decarboxylase